MHHYFICHEDRKRMCTHYGKLLITLKFQRILVVSDFLFFIFSLGVLKFLCHSCAYIKRKMEISWLRYSYNVFLLRIWLFWSLFEAVTLRSVFFTHHRPLCLENAGDAAFLSLFFFKCIYFYFWLRWVFVAARRLSLVAASRGYSFLRCAGFSLRWLLCTGSRRPGFSSCGTWAQ